MTEWSHAVPEAVVRDFAAGRADWPAIQEWYGIDFPCLLTALGELGLRCPQRYEAEGFRPSKRRPILVVRYPGGVRLFGTVITGTGECRTEILHVPDENRAGLIEELSR
jgi:hypothetical protein